MGFKTVDAARTTNLPVCDEGPMLGQMEALLAPAQAKAKPRSGTADAFDATAEQTPPEAAVALEKGTS